MFESKLHGLVLKHITVLIAGGDDYACNDCLSESGAHVVDCGRACLVPFRDHVACRSRKEHASRACLAFDVASEGSRIVRRNPVAAKARRMPSERMSREVSYDVCGIMRLLVDEA